METRSEKEVIFCGCGCGNIFTRFDSRNRERKYISGHNPSVIKEKGKRISYNCEFCNKLYSQVPSYFKKGNYHFCSRTCKAKWIGNKLKNDLQYKEKQRQIAKLNGNKPPLHLKENHWNWKGGISKQNRGQDYKYVQWRKDVLKKDNFTCGICKIRGGKLSAHHKKEWSKYPKLRYDVDNGECLCYLCHMKLHGLNKKVA